VVKCGAELESSGRLAASRWSTVAVAVSGQAGHTTAWSGPARVGRQPGLADGRDRLDLLGSIDDRLGELGQASVAAADSVAKQREGFGHVQMKAFGQHALGLFDQDAAVQRGLQLVRGEECAQERGVARNWRWISCS
jgi:hypothetical protein